MEDRNFPRIEWVFILLTGYMLGIEAIQLNSVDYDTISAQYHISEAQFTGMKVIMPLSIAFGAFIPPLLMRIVHDQAVFWIATYTWFTGSMVCLNLSSSIAALLASQIVKGLACGVLCTHLPLVIHETTPDLRLCAWKLTLLETSYMVGVLIMALVTWETDQSLEQKWLYTTIPIFVNLVVVFFVPKHFHPSTSWSIYPSKCASHKRRSKYFKIIFSHFLPVVTGQQQIIWNRVAIFTSFALPTKFINICSIVLYVLCVVGAIFGYTSHTSCSTPVARKIALILSGLLNLFILFLNMPSPFQGHIALTMVSVVAFAGICLAGQTTLSPNVYTDNLPSEFPMVHSGGVFFRYILTTIIAVLPPHYMIFLLFTYLCLTLFMAHDLLY